MTLADRLNKIIDEQNISKREFAKRIGVSENYVYTLTGESKKITTLSPSNWCSVQIRSLNRETALCDLRKSRNFFFPSSETAFQ